MVRFLIPLTVLGVALIRGSQLLQGGGALNFGAALINPLNANPEKCSNTLKQIVGNLPTICLSGFDHFMNLALKGLKEIQCTCAWNFTNFASMVFMLFYLF